MSILDAIKTTKGSLRELAMLPQTEILKLAQMQQIPVTYVAPILNEKAQMVQQAANMQAMAQAAPASITEKNMATIAQAETPAMVPQQAPMGVESLPIDENMYNEQSMAAGGIVAFSPGGMAGFDPLADMYAGGADPFGTAGLPAITDPYELARQRRRAIPVSADIEELRKYLTEARRKEGDRTQNMYARLAEAGFNIMGGESPYALTNIGRGATAALKGYGEDVREAQKQALANRQMAAQLATAERREELDAITAGEAAERAQQEREFRSGESEKKIAAEKEENALNRKLRKELAAAEKSGSAQKMGNSLLNISSRMLQRADTAFQEQTKPGGPLSNLAQAAKGNPEALSRLKITQEQAKQKLNESKSEILQGMKDEYEDKFGVNLDEELRNIFGKSGAPRREPFSQFTPPPAAAISALKADPSKSDEFDKKYGPGSAKKYLGT